MSWLVGVALATAVVLARGPRGRPVGPLAGAARRAPGPGTGVRWATARVDVGSRSRAPSGGFVDRRRARRGPGSPDLTLLVTDVASRLRSGADPRTAWEAVLGHPVPTEGPAAEDLGRTPDTRPQGSAVVAACRLAAELGAPLAPLLDGVAAQLVAQAEADGERRAALAGPRATARVLTWLPVLGVLLGMAVGADPVAVLLDRSIGTTALVLGVLLVLAGRAWTHRLARRAAAAGRAP